MDLGKYSRTNLLTPRSFNPRSYDGEESLSSITIQSVKSDDAIEIYQEMIDRDVANERNIKKNLEYDIKLASALVLSIDGFYDGDKPIENTRENIEKLMSEYEFLRSQVILMAQDDMFFFGN